MLSHAAKLLKLAVVFVATTAISGTSQAAQLTDGEAFGNWRVNCELDQQTSREGCFIVQNLVLREGGQRVLQFAIGFVEETPEPIALISLPLGISLPPGARIQIDDREPKRIPIERCEPNGCRAGMKLGEDILDGLRKGTQISVTFYDAKREPIEVPLSLDGFEEGLAALAAAKS